ncbi:MAG: hypothetical protein PHU56_03450 [Candidatus Pacebacteria bacterium]|nr:hypothetical protein [Candidatus Paceibacterota bacterium]
MSKKIKIVLVFASLFFISNLLPSLVFGAEFFGVRLQIVDAYSQQRISVSGIKALIKDSGGEIQETCFTSGGSCTVRLPAGEYNASIQHMFFECAEPNCPVAFQVTDSAVNIDIKTKFIPAEMDYCSDSDATRDPINTKGVVNIYRKGDNFVTGLVDGCMGLDKARDYSCEGNIYNVTDHICPNGCYQGACVLNCQSKFGEGYECVNADRLEEFKQRCPRQQIDKERLRVGEQFCNTWGGDYCAICEPECNSDEGCSGFSCPENQAPQCLVGQCSCKDIALPDLTVIGTTFSCPQVVYNTGDSISGCSIMINNIGGSAPAFAPKTNLYDVTDSQRWQRLSQIISPSIPGPQDSPKIIFGNFSFASPGNYKLRACVDDDPKEIAEGNEENNCSDVLSLEIKQTLLACSDCGEGLFNTCDEDECEGLGDCIFFNGFLGLSNKCFNQIECELYCETQSMRPVCGNNERTYANECMARCDKEEIAYQGECSRTMDCASVYGPGWWCGTAADKTNQCGPGKGSLRTLLSQLACDRNNTSSCVTCAITECDLNDVHGCADFPCPANQAPQCLGGQCSCKDVVINPPVTTTTPPTSTPVVQCTDSDSGRDYFSKGATEGLGPDLRRGVFNDYCDASDSDVLYEYYCWDTSVAREDVTCGYGCESGVCRRTPATTTPTVPPTTTPDTPACSASAASVCSGFSCPTGQAPQCIEGYCACRDLPRLIDCQRTYNAAYWCSTYDDWVQRCSGMRDSNAREIDMPCDREGGNYCVTCSDVRLACSDCGEGLFNTCDEDECHNLGNECVFSRGALGLNNRCFRQNEEEIIVPLSGNPAAGMVIPRQTFLFNVFPEVNTVSAGAGDTGGKIAALTASGKQLIGNQVFDFSVKDADGNEIHNFTQPITIKIPYTDEQIQGINEDDLKIYVFNEQTNQWDALPTTIDRQNKILTAQTSHFSLALTAVPGAAPGGSAPPNSTAKIIPTGCDSPKECCNVYCSDMAKYTMPVGTACLCSHDSPKGNEQGIIDRVTNWIFYFALVLAPLFILFGAIKFFTAEGDFKKTTGAKKIITWTVIGLAVAICTRVIYHTIRFLIGQ